MEMHTGIVCANYGCRRGAGPMCSGAWHAKCYRQFEHDPFPVLNANDLDDAMVDPDDFTEDDDQYRFQEARDGDHFMTAFQCDQCHFYNLRGRLPIDTEQDKLLQLCICRALLDSFWSRERSTVTKNLTEYRLFLRNSRLLGNNHPFPPRGPFPTIDSDGMEVACNLLIRSLRPGRNDTHVQFETVRKGRSVMSNYVHASAGGIGATALSMGERGGTYVTGSPTNSQWFRRFLNGMHRRMGDTWIPDWALTIDEILAAQAILEEDWQSHSSHPEVLLPITLSGVLFSGVFGSGLRGEEIPQIDLGGLRKHWHEGSEHPRQAHVPLVLKGRFKRQVGEKLYFQPLAVRSNSGVEYKLWLQRTISIYQHLGVTSGPLFRTVVSKTGRVKRATISDMDLLFHDVMKRVQVRHPNLLPGSVNVEEEMSVRRSLRRSFTSQAQNVGIPKDVIEANNRWRKHMHSRGTTPSMDMVERYSEAKATVEFLVRPSLSL